MSLRLDNPADRAGRSLRKLLAAVRRQLPGTPLDGRFEQFTWNGQPGIHVLIALTNGSRKAYRCDLVTLRATERSADRRLTLARLIAQELR